MAVEGYEITIHRSITETILVAGVPRKLFFLNLTLAGAMILGFHSPYILPFSIIIHVGAVYAAKKDPMFLETFIRHVKQKNYYST